MLYVIWGILVIPVIAAGMTLHFKIKEWGKQKWNILPKCLSTWMIVCTGFLGIWARGDSQGLDKKWILAALLLFLLADGLLEVQFFLGMGVFGAGHLILIGWFLTRGAYTPVSFFWWLLFMGISLYIFRRELEGGKENPWLYAMILYPAVLMGMTAVAVMLPSKLGPDYLRAAVGAVCRPQLLRIQTAAHRSPRDRGQVFAQGDGDPACRRSRDAASRRGNRRY